MANLALLSDDDARRLLREQAARVGGYSALARLLGCSVQFVHRSATTGRPTGVLLQALGLKSVTISGYLRAGSDG